MSKSSFKLRSGNSPLFKMMGSSPAKDDPHTTTEDHPAHEIETTSYSENPEVDYEEPSQEFKDMYTKFIKEQESDTSKTSKRVIWTGDE